MPEVTITAKSTQCPNCQEYVATTVDVTWKDEKPVEINRELQATCEALVTSFDECDDMGDWGQEHETNELVNRLEAAVAKAKGKP